MVEPVGQRTKYNMVLALCMLDN